VNRVARNCTLTRGRPGVLRCRSGVAGDSHNQDRHPGDVPWTEDWEGPDGINRRSLRARCRATSHRPASSHPVCWIPRSGNRRFAGVPVCGSDGPRSTVGRTAFSGITEDGGARPRRPKEADRPGVPRLDNGRRGDGPRYMELLR
jgi:hypothetical protein